MKYEAPELTALTPAIDAIQSNKPEPGGSDNSRPEIDTPAYQDWE